MVLPDCIYGSLVISRPTRTFTLSLKFERPHFGSAYFGIYNRTFCKATCSNSDLIAHTNLLLSPCDLFSFVSLQILAEGISTALTEQGAELHVGTVAGSEILAIGLPKCAYQSVAVLSIDLAICVAMTSVKVNVLS